MTKQFMEKVLKFRMVDTRNYRYVAEECHNADEQWLEIRRLPLELLDTTAALTEWETVAKIS